MQSPTLSTLMSSTLQRGTMVLATLLVAWCATALLHAQEPKRVPKDSVRVAVAGCTHDYIFTAAPRLEGQEQIGDIPEGMHLRMNAPRKMMADIKAHEGSVVLITGLMRKGQYRPGGVGIGGGIRVSPGPANGEVGTPGSASLSMIDIEGWRMLPLACPSH